MTFRALLAASAALLAAHAGSASAQAPAAAPAATPTPAPAASADAAVTPEAAKALEAQIRTWFSALSSPGMATSPAPVQVTPEGDHFALVAPFKLQGGMRGETSMTAQAKPLPGGRWSIANIRTTLPFSFVLDTPVPPKEGEKGPPRTVPVTYTINAEAQDGSVDYDPSFATPSEWKTSAKSLTVLAEGPGIAHATGIAAVNSDAKLIPAAPGLVDFVSNGRLSGYTLASKATDDTPAVTLSMETGSVDISASGVSRSQVGKLVEVAAAMGVLARTAAPGTAPKPPPEMIRAMLDALQGLASEVKLNEAFQGVKLNVAGMDFAASDAGVGVSSRSEGGLIHAGMNLSYDGFAMPDMGMGGMEQLVPRKMVLRPYVSGISFPDLVRLGTAMDQKRDPTPAEINAVFSHGGVVTGLDELLLDVAGASFTGTGKVTMTSLQQVSGTGRVSAENFDALVQKLGDFPMAQQAMPAVIFLKGIGKTDGGKLVWDISYAGGKLLVNNMDLSAMAGGPGPKPQPGHPGPAPRQNRNR